MEEETRQLIQSCKKGDISAFETLVHQNAGRVSNIIYQMIGTSSDVDDLSQEVFIKVYQHIKYFREEAKFSTWLYRVTVNTVWDYLRGQKHRKTIPLEEIEPIYGVEVKNNTELKDLLHAQIQALPIKYRSIIILKEIEGLSYNEIADILKCSLGTVESRLFRARQFLKESLERTKWWKDFII